MSASFQHLMNSDPLAGLAALVLTFVGYVLLGLVPACAVCYVFYFLLTLPMRRNERARWFLDLLELGLKAGRTPEAAIGEAASSRDRALGVRFHLLTAYLEQGMRLSEALERVPALLPPEVRAILKTGERIGDMRRVLPACRTSLKDGISQVRGALNYVILLVFAVTPFYVLVPLVLKTKVLPKYREVFAGMLDSAQLPAFTRLVFGHDSWLIAGQIGVVCLLWLLALAYLGGPRLRGWPHKLMPAATDAFLWRLSWRRKRIQRDFSAIFAVLLDSGVPESEAVDLAATATGNLAFRQRAAIARARLKQGIRLPEAMSSMDDSGELRWRLANAVQRGGGFLRALTGWHEALDARAFQLEQAAAQITTTLVVLLNGFIVASLMIAIFLALIHLINAACLW